jgi:predicted nucleic acid-binding protein
LYLVDTKILSAGAPAKAATMPSLMDWMNRNSARLFLSAIAIAEVEDGIAKSRRFGAHRKADRLSPSLAGASLSSYGRETSIARRMSTSRMRLCPGKRGSNFRS